MLNTPWYAKIDAQELFYFIILLVGGTLIYLSVSMKARLELYTDAHGTLIFDNYDECSPKIHEKAHRAEVGYCNDPSGKNVTKTSDGYGSVS